MKDTRSKILQVARRLFAEQGYTATSMRQVAEQAGIGKATIYHHFPDKEAMFVALVEGNIGKMEQALAAVKAEPDPKRRIEVAARASIHFLFESADILQIARREVPGARDYLRDYFVSFLHQYIDLLSEAIEKGIVSGIYRPVDPRDAARVFMTMIQGTFATAYIAGERARNPEQAAESLLDVFFHGIQVTSQS